MGETESIKYQTRLGLLYNLGATQWTTGRMAAAEPLQKKAKDMVD